MTKEELALTWGHFYIEQGQNEDKPYIQVPNELFITHLNEVIRDELIRYKIWENIFGGNYDTIEPMVDEYLTEQT